MFVDAPAIQTQRDRAVAPEAVKPPRLNFARRWIYCLERDCDSPRCKGLCERSRWAVCPECDGREGDGVSGEQCVWWCTFGVVEIAPLPRGGVERRRAGRAAAVTGAAESLELRAARQVVERLNDPDTGGRYERWVERARGCSHPVHLRGISREADAATCELVRESAARASRTGCC